MIQCYNFKLVFGLDRTNGGNILSKLMECLRPGGYLVMGAGESLIGTDIELDQLSLSGALVFQKTI